MTASPEIVDLACDHWMCKEDRGTYTLAASCYNCGATFCVRLTRGHSHIGSHPECPMCGVDDCTSWGGLVAEPVS